MYQSRVNFYYINVLMVTCTQQDGVILWLSSRFSNNCEKFQIHFPKLNFTYSERSSTLILSFVILRNSEQRHMLKIIVVFRLPFYATRESQKLLTSLEYWN